MCFVVPCFNEEEILPEMAGRLAEKIEMLCEARLISPESRVLFVDDGSTDKTWDQILRSAKAYKTISGIALERNLGQQTALYAGLLEIKDSFDAAISVDADGQHDLAAVDQMLRAFTAGNEIVFAVRQNRDAETAFKLITGSLYYSLLALLRIRTVKGHADFRLVSAGAIRMLEDMPKGSIFLRGIFPSLPLKSAVVKYCCLPRLGGKSKYSLKKMLLLAVDGLICGGIRPAAAIGACGVILSVAAPVLRAAGDSCVFILFSALSAASGIIFLCVFSASYVRYRRGSGQVFKVTDRI